MEKQPEEAKQSKQSKQPANQTSSFVEIAFGTGQVNARSPPKSDTKRFKQT